MLRLRDKVVSIFIRKFVSESEYKYSHKKLNIGKNLVKR